jgi:hypothetical protein
MANASGSRPTRELAPAGTQPSLQAARDALIRVNGERIDQLPVHFADQLGALDVLAAVVYQVDVSLILVGLVMFQDLTTSFPSELNRGLLAGKALGSLEEVWFTSPKGNERIEGWVLKPPGFDPAKKYPILFYAYSEPAGQTAIDSWQGTNYLWFLMLTQQGYVVASVDNRGTPSPRGRNFRKRLR